MDRLARLLGLAEGTRVHKQTKIVLYLLYLLVGDRAGLAWPCSERCAATQERRQWGWSLSGKPVVVGCHAPGGPGTLVLGPFAVRCNHFCVYLAWRKLCTGAG